MDWISVDDNGHRIMKGKAGWGHDPADIALLTELHNEARDSRPPTAGEIAYDEAHEVIADLWDALAALERREYTAYAQRLTVAIQTRLDALQLPTPVTINISPAPDDARDYDARAPAPSPRNAIERAIDDAIANTPTPSTPPDTPLERLDSTPLPTGKVSVRWLSLIQKSVSWPRWSVV